MKTLRILVAAVLLSVAAFGGFEFSSQMLAATPPASGNRSRGGEVMVEVERVQSQTFTEAIEAIGTTMARQSVTLRPVASGRVTEIAFSAGDRVEAGQPLVRLNDAAAHATLASAEATVAEAQARRDANGDPLLSPEEVEAGERLREDYELAQIGPKVGQDWRRFLTPAVSGSAGPGRTPSEGPMFARDRVARALDCLGPGLSDAAVRICCFLEGLEATERRMGWSARSGKVVLKLALQRLVDHYGLSQKEKAA